MQIRKQKSWIQQIRDEYQAEVKKLRRRRFLLKVKVILTVVLPILIVLISIKVMKTWIRIKVRSLFAKPKENQPKCGNTASTPQPEPAKPAAPVPAEMTPVEKEIITPVPAAEQSDITTE